MNAQAEPSAADATGAQLGQSAETARWTVTVDPLTTAIGYVHVQVERALSPRLAIYVGPHLKLFEGILADEDEPEDFYGFGVEAGVRWFFSDTAPYRWWVGARGVASLLQTNDDRPETERALGGYVSALGGYTWQATPWLVLSGGLGVQYIHLRVADMGPKRFFPAAHTALGVAF